MFSRKNARPARQPREVGPDTRRVRMVFRGQVQGVGFRWTAQRVAHEVGLTGWVRNEHDGSVTMEAQGTDEMISEFFGLFNRSYARYPINYVIDDKEDLPIDPTDVDFEVRFSSSSW